MISIVIPTYNRADLIKYTLDSLKSIYHKNQEFEIIVIDDGSTDDTLAFVSANYPQVLLLKNTKKGASSARNMGLAAATGKYVVYLDSDDLIGEGFFTEKIALLEKDASLDACYGEYEYFSSDADLHPDNIMFKYKYPMISGADHAQQHMLSYLSENYIPSLAIIWRRSFLLKCKGHDESLSINQDVDLFVRALFNDMRISAVSDGTKVYVRDHALGARVGTAKGGTKKWEDMLELRKKIFKELPASVFNKVENRKAISYFVFSYWKILRHTEKDMAAQYLQFAKEAYWPVEIRGNAGFRLLANIFGPVNAVKLKYLLIKRD